MKNVATSAALILVAGSALTGCRAIGDIFKAGVWSGVIVVVILVAIVGGVFALLRGR
jgi:hypothetical protein